MEIQIYNFTGYEDSCEVSYFDEEGNHKKTLFLTELDLLLYHNDKKGLYGVTINKVNALLYEKDKDFGTEYKLDDFELFEIQCEMVNYINWQEWEANRLTDDNFLE